MLFIVAHYAGKRENTYEATITNMGCRLVSDDTLVRENTMEVDLVSASIGSIAILDGLSEL